MFTSVTNTVFGCLVVVLLVVAGAVGVAVCSDGPCTVCEHGCASIAHHTGRVRRLGRLLVAAIAPPISSAKMVISATLNDAPGGIHAPVLAASLSRVSALRI